MEQLDNIISKQPDKMTAIEYVIWRLWLTSQNNNPKGESNQKTIYDAQKAAAELARITAENVELKRLLIEQVGEHGWINGGDYPDFCGTCENTAKQGHKADCKLAAALK